VALFAVVDKAGFERGLDAGHHGFVDIAFALFAPFNFDFVVEQFLSIDDGQAAFFRLGGIDQHPFHVCVPLLANNNRSMADQRCREPMLEKETGNRAATEFGASTAPTFLRGRGGRDAEYEQAGLGAPVGSRGSGCGAVKCSRLMQASATPNTISNNANTRFMLIYLAVILLTV
jgi:hypothetical protein